MAARLQLTDPAATQDLDTYLARAQAVLDGGSVRVIVSGPVLAIYAPVPEGTDWVAEPGDFEAIVAASSTDIKSKVGFKLK